MSTKNPVIKEATEEVFILTAEEEERNLERFRENAILERKLDRGEWLEEGIEIGIERGKKEGKIEGKIEGKLEGKMEGKLETTITIAKQMLIKKYTVSEIMFLTGLSKNEIIKLAKKV